MEKAKGVIAKDEAERRAGELSVVEGRVVYSETKETAYGSCLSIGLEGDEREFWWQHQAVIPVHIVVGNKIRGFYTHNSSPPSFEAYELLNEKGDVLTRGISKKFTFVKYVKVVV